MVVADSRTSKKDLVNHAAAAGLALPKNGRASPTVIEELTRPAISQSCEISGNSTGKDDNEPDAGAPADQPVVANAGGAVAATAPVTTTSLLPLYEEYQPTRELKGDVEDSTWTARARAVMKAALVARERYLAAGAIEQAVLRARITADSGRKRGPKESNVDLISVYCAVTAKSKEEQKNWSRFANVVKIAATDGVTEETAEDFLRANNLTRCLERARATKVGPAKPKIVPPKLLKGYPPLVKAWQAGELDQLLSKLSKEVEAANAAAAE